VVTSLLRKDKNGLAAGQGSKKVRLRSKINSDATSARVEVLTSVKILIYVQYILRIF